MIYCLDTNTISYFLKQSPKVTAKILNTPIDNLCTTIISEFELLYGVYNSSKVDTNLESISNFLSEFSIYNLDSSVVKLVAKEKTRLKKLGTIVEDSDLLIAGICIVNDLTLVTNNLKHFKRIKGLKAEDWSQK
ncbi:MAG: PIN domain-containing protein [bacterium]